MIVSVFVCLLFVCIVCLCCAATMTSRRWARSWLPSRCVCVTRVHTSSEISSLSEMRLLVPSSSDLNCLVWLVVAARRCSASAWMWRTATRSTSSSSSGECTTPCHARAIVCTVAALNLLFFCLQCLQQGTQDVPEAHDHGGQRGDWRDGRGAHPLGR